MAHRPITSSSSRVRAGVDTRTLGIQANGTPGVGLDDDLLRATVGSTTTGIVTATATPSRAAAMSLTIPSRRQEVLSRPQAAQTVPAWRRATTRPPSAPTASELHRTR